MTATPPTTREEMRQSLERASTHAYGFEAIEKHVCVEEFHRARCQECGWESEEFDEFAWQDAEEAAMEHWAECPKNPDNEDDDEFEDEVGLG